MPKESYRNSFHLQIWCWRNKCTWTSHIAKGSPSFGYRKTLEWDLIPKWEGRNHLEFCRANEAGGILHRTQTAVTQVHEVLLLINLSHVSALQLPVVSLISARFPFTWGIGSCWESSRFLADAQWISRRKVAGKDRGIKGQKGTRWMHQRRMRWKLFHLWSLLM